MKKILVLSSTLLFVSCASADFTEIRALFLPPVNYAGGICRISNHTMDEILTPRVQATDPGLARKIASLLSRVSRYYSFSIVDPASGFVILWNDNLVFHGASTYKAAIYIAIMKMHQEKKISIEDSIDIKNRFFSIVDQSEYSIEDDNTKPDIIFSKTGEKVTIRELLKEMITHSSNLATNLLIARFGTQAINAELADMGIHISVVRGVSDDRAYAECINNTVTSGHLVSLYRAIYDENIFNRSMREKIITVLNENDETKLFPAELPEKTIVAHKPGNTSKVFHDAGIVVPATDNSPYYITVLSSQYKHGITKTFAEISRLAYDAILEARLKNLGTQTTPGFRRGGAMVKK